MTDEANNYYDEAKLKREAAINALSFSAKEKMLQKAYELEMKAIEVQKRAILQLSENSAEPIVSDVNKGSVNEGNKQGIDS